jgi:nucleoid-associated protein YgaU
MNQKTVQAIIAIAGLGVGLALGIMITNSKGKATIADLQSKLQQSEAASQEKISNYDTTIERLNNELKQANEKLNPSASAPEGAVITTAKNKKTASASGNNAIPDTVKLYTVKDGDSLWKIARNQLGDGNRFKEILKLNPNISANDNLAVSTKLKIPSK